MTVPGWNAHEYHMKHNDRPPRARTNWFGVVGVGFLIVAAAVSATQVADLDDGSKLIGICHHTGSDKYPYVLLVVEEDSYEHGHHRHNELDYFLDDPNIGCMEDMEVPDEADIPDEEGEVDDGAEAPVDDAPVDDVPVEDDADAVDDTADDAPDADDSEDAVEESEETVEEADNETVDEPAPLGDLVASQSAWQDDFEVALTLQVTNAGEGNISEARLSDTLPDLRRTWYLGGADSDACVLSGLDLACWFGELAPGESRSIEVRAFTDRMPCGYPQTNTAEASGLNEELLDNNASSASIAARSC